MATYQYTTRPQQERGLRIILTPPRVIAHCKQHGFIQKQNREETEHNKLYEINMSQSKNQRENQTKLDFLLCLVKYIAARDEPQERMAIKE